MAVLHDVVEDTDVTLDGLRRRGFSAQIVAAVDAVTKVKGESLDESMERVKTNPLALIVKRADISQNADPARQTGLSDESRVRLTVKYEKSARLLGTTLEEILAQHGPTAGEICTPSMLPRAVPTGALSELVIDPCLLGLDSVRGRRT